MHWVACYGYTDNDFYIMDPWTGTFTLLSIYGTLRNAVYSYRYYDKKLSILAESGGGVIDSSEDSCISQERYDKVTKQVEELTKQLKEQNDAYVLEKQIWDDAEDGFNKQIKALQTDNAVLGSKNEELLKDKAKLEEAFNGSGWKLIMLGLDRLTKGGDAK